MQNWLCLGSKCQGALSGFENLELLKGPRSSRFRRRIWVISATNGKAMNTPQVYMEITDNFRFLLVTRSDCCGPRSVLFCI